MEKEIYITGVNNWYDLKAQSWSGALQTLDAIEEKGKEEEFINLLNDIIWFDTDYIEEALNVKLWGEDND